VKSENFQSVTIERDGQVCFDALNGDFEECSWAIASRCSDMLELSKEFVSCNFCRIKRDADYVTHSLAKFASFFFFSYNISYLPLTVWEAWK
jgi:hypothetical protein